MSKPKCGVYMLEVAKNAFDNSPIRYSRALHKLIDLFHHNEKIRPSDQDIHTIRIAVKYPKYTCLTLEHLAAFYNFYAQS
jgi:hypothetical protein